MQERTISQKMAQSAHERVEGTKPAAEFLSFAREFPSLAHSCGLAQAVAFAKRGKSSHQKEYLDALRGVLKVAGHAEASSDERFCQAVRNSSVAAYIRLSRNALLAADWLKRYAEAAAKE